MIRTGTSALRIEGAAVPRGVGVAIIGVVAIVGNAIALVGLEVC